MNGFGKSTDENNCKVMEEDDKVLPVDDRLTFKINSHGSEEISVHDMDIEATENRVATRTTTDVTTADTTTIAASLTTVTNCTNPLPGIQQQLSLTNGNTASISTVNETTNHDSPKIPNELAADTELQSLSPLPAPTAQSKHKHPDHHHRHRRRHHGHHREDGKLRISSGDVVPSSGSGGSSASSVVGEDDHRKTLQTWDLERTMTKKDSPRDSEGREFLQDYKKSASHIRSLTPENLKSVSSLVSTTRPPSFTTSAPGLNLLHRRQPGGFPLLFPPPPPPPPGASQQSAPSLAAPPLFPDGSSLLPPPLPCPLGLPRLDPFDSRHDTVIASLSTNLLSRAQQELNARFLQERVSPPSFSARAPPAEMHQHQHVHQHMHQHFLPPPPPSSIAAVATAASLHSGKSSSSPSLPFHRSSQLDSSFLISPNVPPSRNYPNASPLNLQGAQSTSAYCAMPAVNELLGAFQPKGRMPGLGLSPTSQLLLGSRGSLPGLLLPPIKKSIRWCAAHVRVAWEIHIHQQQQQALNSISSADSVARRTEDLSTGSKGQPLPAHSQRHGELMQSLSSVSNWSKTSKSPTFSRNSPFQTALPAHNLPKTGSDKFGKPSDNFSGSDDRQKNDRQSNNSKEYNKERDETRHESRRHRKDESSDRQRQNEPQQSFSNYNHRESLRDRSRSPLRNGSRSIAPTPDPINHSIDYSARDRPSNYTANGQTSPEFRAGSSFPNFPPLLPPSIGSSNRMPFNPLWNSFRSSGEQMLAAINHERSQRIDAMDAMREERMLRDHMRQLDRDSFTDILLGKTVPRSLPSSFGFPAPELSFFPNPPNDEQFKATARHFSSMMGIPQLASGISPLMMHELSKSFLQKTSSNGQFDLR